MNKLEQNNIKGPWGQNTEAVDAARQQTKEEDITKASEKSKKIADYTEELKKRVGTSPEDAKAALEEVITPYISIRFDREMHVIQGFVETILRETYKKYGEEEVKNIVPKGELAAVVKWLKEQLTERRGN